MIERQLEVLVMLRWWSVLALVSVAQAAPRVHLSADGSCPSKEEVAAELAHLIPIVEDGGLVAHFMDEGALYWVALGGHERELVDDSRNCAERARTVALVIAFAIDPPTVALPAAPTTPPRATPSAPLPAAATESAAVRQAPSGREGKPPYPRSLVERPLILPRLMFAPTVSADFTNGTFDLVLDKAIYGSENRTGESFTIGLDVGLGHRIQTGIYVAFPINPNANFGTFLTNLQIGLARQVNLRFDLGVDRTVATGVFFPGLIDGLVTLRFTAFVAGVGLPTKVKLHRMFAFVSGSSQARGFALPRHYVFSSADESYFFSALSTSNDLLTIEAYEESTLGAFSLPVGLLFQPHRRFSLSVRTGYRLLFTVSNKDGAIGLGYTSAQHAVPLSFEAVVNVARPVDLGFTFEMPGPVGGADPWTTYRMMSAWVGLHL